MIDLIRLKSHLRIEDNSEDDYLEFILAAAIQAVADYLDRVIVNNPDDLETVENSVLINKSIEIAILMTAGHFYENREATSTLTVKEVPMSSHFLLNPHRNISA
ncbi:putative phage protein (possible DNA packaging) (plasmid) [Piscirickettsia salmonis]|uniref:head-tail connector protein n=1 Tax=Piscirickettsia salmonis TaxID=1238 RepID=UPI0012B91C33|nr:head-tail connector protein [Piscirickettsia salmonis]QGP52374.1 putative phage protein (possible DNA packaging) [Piscirickettsia salmonis]